MVFPSLSSGWFISSCLFPSSVPSQAEIRLALPFLGKLIHYDFKNKVTSQIYVPPHVSSLWISGYLDFIQTAVPLPVLRRYLREAQDQSFLHPEPWLPLRGDPATTQPPLCPISAFPTPASGLLWPSWSHRVHNTPLSLPSTLTQATYCLLSSFKEIVEGRQEGAKGRDYWSGKNRPMIKIAHTFPRSQGPLWMGHECQAWRREASKVSCGRFPVLILRLPLLHDEHVAPWGSIWSKEPAGLCQHSVQKQTKGWWPALG